MNRSLIALSKANMYKLRNFSTEIVKKNYILEYHYVENMLERRIPVRSLHLEYANRMVESKLLIAGGACMPKAESGILLLYGTENDIKQFAENDPYVTKGLVTRYTIREWNIAVGKV